MKLCQQSDSEARGTSSEGRAGFRVVFGGEGVRKAAKERGFGEDVKCELHLLCGLVTACSVHIIFCLMASWPPYRHLSGAHSYRRMFYCMGLIPAIARSKPAAPAGGKAKAHRQPCGTSKTTWHLGVNFWESLEQT